MSDVIYDKDVFEYESGKKSIDFRLDVPKKPHDDLRSSALIKADGTLKRFELRLGLLPFEKMQNDDTKERMEAIIEDMDLSDDKYDAGIDPAYAMNVKLGYDPHWGEQDHAQIHLQSGFWSPEISEEEVFEFAEEYTERYIEEFWQDE